MFLRRPSSASNLSEAVREGLRALDRLPIEMTQRRFGLVLREGQKRRREAFRLCRVLYSAGPTKPAVGLAGLALLVVMLGASSCAFQNPHRLPCLRQCADEKDTCVLEATDAQAIQSCDVHEKRCSALCPQ